MIKTAPATVNLPVLASSASQIPPHLNNAYYLLLLVAGMLLAVFVLTIMAVRLLRRYRQRYIAHRQTKPTPNDDLWAQYRLPEEPQKDHDPSG